jgi:hypothetical protein
VISRTATAICAVLAAAMMGAALWRIGILPDWCYGPDGPPPTVRAPAMFFMAPGCLVLAAAILTFATLPARARVPALEPWQRWVSAIMIGYAIIGALQQFHLVAVSAHVALPFPPSSFARAAFVLTWGLIVVGADRMQKLPYHATRFGIWRLDPVRQAQQLRLAGRGLVVAGIAMIIASCVMPLRMIMPLTVSVSLALFVVAAVNKFRLLREQAHERLHGGR